MRNIDRVNIALCFDEEYLIPSAVTVLSALRNGNGDTNYHFYMITEMKDSVDEEIFVLLQKQYPNFSYEYLFFSDATFCDSFLPAGGPSGFSFAKLYLPEILSSLDYCIFLDGDILVLDDIAKLLSYADSEKFSRCYLAAAPDFALQTGQGKFYEEHRELLGMKDVSDYFNSGVMILNLKKMRKDAFLRKASEYADKGLLFGDQDILNIICNGKTVTLPACWNIVSFNLYDRELLGRIQNSKNREDLEERNIKIMHFAGPDKPWNSIETEWEQVWADYANLLPDTETTVKLKAKNTFKRLNNVMAELEFPNIGNDFMLFGFTPDSRDLVRRLYDGNQRLPTCFIDNNPQKQGRVYKKIPCISFEKAKVMMDSNTTIIICAQKAWKEIRVDLLNAGVDNSQVVRFRLRDRKLVTYEKKYSIGLLMGVFDLFHIGHLNLIRRAKAQCQYLRIGVLSDLLVHEFKRIYPSIPQDERMEILRALRDVDEVVLLETKEDVSRLNEWKKRPFDCFFSGDDYVDNVYWAWEKKELKKLGADMVFFPYTKKRSSSMIRKKLQEKGDEEKK